MIIEIYPEILKKNVLLNGTANPAHFHTNWAGLAVLFSRQLTNKSHDLFRIFSVGAVHKLHLQEEGVRWSKNWLYVNFYTIEDVIGGSRRSKKPNLVNAVCERSHIFFIEKKNIPQIAVVLTFLTHIIFTIGGVF